MRRYAAMSWSPACHRSPHARSPCAPGDHYSLPSLAKFSAALGCPTRVLSDGHVAAPEQVPQEFAGDRSGLDWAHLTSAEVCPGSPRSPTRLLGRDGPRSGTGTSWHPGTVGRQAIFSSHSAGVHPTIAGCPKRRPVFQAGGMTRRAHEQELAASHRSAAGAADRRDAGLRCAPCHSGRRRRKGNL